MNRAKLNSLIASERQYVGRNPASLSSELIAAFRAGHAAGYKDGVAQQASTDQGEGPADRPSESPQKATSGQPAMLCPSCRANWTAVEMCQACRRHFLTTDQNFAAVLPKPPTADLCRNRAAHVSAWSGIDRKRCPACDQAYILEGER